MFYLIAVLFMKSSPSVSNKLYGKRHNNNLVKRLRQWGKTDVCVLSSLKISAIILGPVLRLRRQIMVTQKRRQMKVWNWKRKKSSY